MNLLLTYVILSNILITNMNAISIKKIFKFISPIHIAKRILGSQIQNEKSIENKNGIEKENKNELTPIEKYNMGWYVVADATSIKTNQPYKITVWNKDYVIWKTPDNIYHALEDVCSHKGAALSIGTLHKNRIVCPYHGYEFSHTGNLTIVPGICFQPSSQQNIARFSVVEKHGWIYLNTFEIPWFATHSQINELNQHIFVEPEANDESMSAIYINQQFYTYPRVVSENSLDIMHIAYVHTFGNKDRPAPTYEDPPKQLESGHWRTSYGYESGKDSMISKIFKLKKIDIENEFALPHTTVARVKFGEGLINTIITAACPINETTTMLFVKSYRNFFTGPIFDYIFTRLMDDTLKQDKAIIETIKRDNADGKFNMKYDKLQNTYKTLYKKHVKN